MIDSSKPVRVFKNPQMQCYSIMQGGVVRASARQILLKDAQFLVRESGRQRMLASRKRNVHAYVVGELVDFAGTDEDRNLTPVEGRLAHYNPYLYSAFVDRETEAPLDLADTVQLDERGVVYCDMKS